MALWHVLRSLGFDCVAAHCNFHLRGAESDRDEQFVRDLCGQLGVPLHVRSFDTQAEAARCGESIEMAARRLRYAWFEELRRAREAACICVAHHEEDSAETLLLNLLRGSGLRGLCGIRPRNGQVVRPLLCLSRADIEAYLQALGQDYVTDSTNLLPDCRRNEVRLRLLPLMEQINPSVRATLAATAGRLAEAEAVYRAAVDRAVPEVFDGHRIALDALGRFPSPGALLHEILAPYGFTPAQEEALLRAGQSGLRVCTAEWEVLRDRDALLATKNDEGRTVEEMVTEKSGQTGEKIELAYYARIEAPFCDAYVHFNKKLGTILGFNKPVPAEVAHTVAMQATAMAPVSIDVDDCPADVVAHERQIAIEAMKQDPKNANKPEEILAKIAEGKMRKFFEENTLLNQLVVGEKETIRDYIHKADKEATVVAYKRFALGE